MTSVRPLLELRNVAKHYDAIGRADAPEVLRAVSLEVIAGESVAVVGPSGSGKSTLLNIIGGLDLPTSGEVFLDGVNLATLPPDELARVRNREIGLVFQLHHLLPEFTALENVSIPQMISGISISDDAIKSKELLSTVGLSERMDHKPAELSGGEQQRVAVARALANNPQIIFGDEPTGNLDSKNSESIHQLILELRDNLKVTLVIVTHNPNLVKLADKVYEMKDGKVFRK